MTKKYGIILFCFFITTNINIIAQLPNDIAYFAQTLQNIVLMLTHVVPPPHKPSGAAGTGAVVPPPSTPFVDRPTGTEISVVGGKGKLSDGTEIIVPLGSKLFETSEGPVIVFPPQGGTGELPSWGGYVGSTVDSIITLPNKTVVAMPANKYLKIEDEGVVVVQPKGAVPPPLIPPSGKPTTVVQPLLTPLDGKKIPVPSSGSVNTPQGNLKLPKDSIVTAYPSGDVNIKLFSDGSATLPNKTIVKAPTGSSITLTKMGPSPIVTLPVTGGSATIPPDGTVRVLVDSTVQLLGEKEPMPVPAGVERVIVGGGTVIVTPVIPGKPAVVPPPLISPVLTPRKDEDVLKVVGNVTQLKAPVGITNAQAVSGYVAVYYAFNELSRTLNKTDLSVTFNQFMEPTALRSIKKRRIQVACKHYIANILTKPPYLVPENLSPELKTPGFGLQFKQVRSIYHSLLTDLAGEIAATYVQTNYTNSATTDQDSLKPSTFILQGKTLISDFKNFVDKRRAYYAAQFKVSAAALSALIDQPEYLASYARINNDTKIEFDARHVLTELRKPNVFGLEEGSLNPNFFDNSGLLKKEYITQAMPKGIWLHEGDIAHLVRDPIVLKVVSLSDTIKDMITIFNDLSLLSVDQMRIFNAGEEMQGKYFINSQILERVAKEEKNKMHIFIVNVGFYFGGSNRPNEYRWVTIARSSDGKYILVDATNADRTKDVNLEIIKQEIAKF